MFSEHKCYGPSPERQQERCVCVWIPETHLPASKIASSIQFPPAANFLTAKQNSGWPPAVDVCPSHRLLLTTWVTWIASTLSFQHFSKVIKWTCFHLPWSLKGLYISKILYSGNRKPPSEPVDYWIVYHCILNMQYRHIKVKNIYKASWSFQYLSACISNAH